MLTSIFITAAITLGLGAALRSPGEERLIARRPYENRYSDAAGARQSRLG